MKSRYVFFILIDILFSFHPVYSQNSVDLRNYFFQQSKLEDTLRYSMGSDTNVRLRKYVEVLGNDTIKISNHNSRDEFYESFTFVIGEKDIKIIQSESVINGAVVNGKINANVWAQMDVKNSKKIQLDIRTEDSCSDQSKDCFWKWERLKQTGLKQGYIYVNKKKVKTITFQFERHFLIQPTHFSSIAGAMIDSQSYTFAEGLGLVDITTKEIKPKLFKQTISLRRRDLKYN